MKAEGDTPSNGKGASRSGAGPELAEMVTAVGSREKRKIRARRRRTNILRYGLGMFGLVGWSIAIPTLAGVALGVWIDSRWPGRLSWTLMLLFGGLILGCLNAWYWIMQESRGD